MLGFPISPVRPAREARNNPPPIARAEPAPDEAVHQEFAPLRFRQPVRRALIPAAGAGNGVAAPVIPAQAGVQPPLLGGFFHQARVEAAHAAAAERENADPDFAPVKKKSRGS